MRLYKSKMTAANTYGFCNAFGLGENGVEDSMVGEVDD